MKNRLASSGYTIVEVMIVMAVSGGLLVSVMTMINGQQRRTEYSTAVRDFELKLQDIFNDVEAGYYPNNDQLQCVDNPNDSSIPTIQRIGVTQVGQEQGTNADCIFVGKALQFYRDANLTSNYRIFTIVGKRQHLVNGQLVDVTNIDSARPTAFFRPNEDNSRNVELGTLRSGLQVTQIRYIDTIPQKTSFGIAVLSSLGDGGSLTQNSISSSDGGSRLAFLDINANNKGELQAQGEIRPSKLNSSAITDASKGVVVCLNDGPGGRHAAVTVGVYYDPTESDPTKRIKPSGQRLSTEAYFDDEADRFGCSW